MKRECKNCNFFKDGGAFGECRVSDPQIINIDGHYGRWPTIKRDDWCGRFVAIDRTAIAVVIEQPFIKE